MIKSITERRTIRKYSNKEVSKELIIKLLETASRAATMGNMQLYSVVINESEDMKNVLSSLHFNQPMVKSAQFVLTFCADFNRFSFWCKERNAEPGYNNFLSFLNAASDTLLFTQNFCTLAEDEGLGTCYLGTTLYNAEEIIRVLNLPKLTFPIAAITIGYPDEIPPQQDRLDISYIIHDESYNNYDSEMINNIYKFKESLKENKNFVSINNKENLAQIFTDIRYTKSANEIISKKLFNTLNSQGFF